MRIADITHRSADWRRCRTAVREDDAEEEEDVDGEEEVVDEEGVERVDEGDVEEVDDCCRRLLRRCTDHHHHPPTQPTPRPNVTKQTVVVVVE